MTNTKNDGFERPAALAVAWVATTLVLPAGPARAADGPGVLEEVIVTANRREENVARVPVSIEVLSGEALESAGATQFEDYLNSVSSVGFTKSGSGAVRIGIRGISNVNGDDTGVAKSKSAVGLY